MGKTAFGSNLRTLRISLDMTASELSKRSGLTPACISQIETGHREPTLSTIIKILDVLPVKFEHLIRKTRP